MLFLKRTTCLAMFFLPLFVNAQITDQYKGGSTKRTTNTKADAVLNFPALSKKIYKQGWIDFNKDGVKDIF
ncbi:MAG TPA: hypothetical protein PLS00_10840, partial [Niabella sp.]|nr:hypothetical protein [Niabella sp.]